MRNGGRQKGTPNKRTEAAKSKAEDGGLLPLDIMLENARWARDQALATFKKAEGDFADGTQSDDHLKYRRLANEWSKDAAPYVHSRLSSVDQKLSGTMTLEQLVTESFQPPADKPAQPVKH